MEHTQVSWFVSLIPALKCLADLLCKSGQAHATLPFKSVAWKPASESHCKLPDPSSFGWHLPPPQARLDNRTNMLSVC